MDCSLPGSSIHGIFQARILEWVAISFSRGSSQSRDRTQVFHIVGRCFTVWATREVPSVPWPGTELWPWQWMPRILTTRQPGNSSPHNFNFISSISWLVKVSMYQYIRSFFFLEILLLGPSVSLLLCGPVIPYYYMVVNMILSQNSLCFFHVLYLFPGSQTPFSKRCIL